MSVNNSAVALPAAELIQAMTGSNVLIGTLTQKPVILILDNQSSSTVVLSIDLVQWKTFPAGECLILDMRAAHGYAENFAFGEGTSFYGNGAATGSFSISYIYARNG